MGKRILTLHPQGKQGVNIDQAKYDQIRAAIVLALEQHRELAFGELITKLEAQLSGKFQGSIPWYVTTVKLDLEARRVLKRVPGSSPQLLRLVQPVE